MGRPRKYPLPEEVNKGTQQPPQPEQTVKLSDVQGIVDAAVKKAVDARDNPNVIDDSGFWQAKCRCQSEIFGCLDAEMVIKLSEENEKKLKLGKFAEIRKDPKTGMDVRISYAHLQKPSQFTLQRIMQVGEPRAVEEGLLILPSLNVNQSLDEKKPFRLVTQAP